VREGEIELRPTVDRSWLERAARVDPIAHALALWDLDRHPERVRFVSAIGPDGPVGYLLIWLGHPVAPIVHWVGARGAAGPLADALPPRPLVAITPVDVVGAVERVRGPASVRPLLVLAAPPSGPEDAVEASNEVRRLGTADRLPLDGFVRAHRDPETAEYPGLDPERETMWGFFEGGELLGVARAAVRGETVWLIGGVYVAPAARGRGIASALVHAAVAAGRKDGATLALYVREDRAGARRLYERAGFRPHGRRQWIDAGAGLDP